MKKIKIIGLVFLTISLTGCTKEDFAVDVPKDFTDSAKNQKVVSNFDNKYALSSVNQDKALDNDITRLSKKTTYLLLGDFNNTNETSENYYKRHEEFLGLRYAPKIPKDENTKSGFDENSQEYKDDLVSGFSVPGMFNKLNELNVIYNSFGNIIVSKTNDMIISSVTLPNVVMKETNPENPMKYNTVTTNLILYYYFKKIDDSYALYYLYAETTDELASYFKEAEEKESKGHLSIIPANSSLNDVYDYSKLNALTEKDFNEVYNKNIANIVVLDAFYNNSPVEKAHGFLINDGLVVTTWNFLEKALTSGQYIAVQGKDQVYQIEGIVTANPEQDIALLKLKDKVKSTAIIGDSSNLKIEDPVVTITSKTGIAFTLQSGIVTANESDIQSTLLLSETDEGSPLLNAKGNIVGINTSKITNSSMTIANNSNILKEVQNKFKNENFDKMETVSFEKLKKNYYSNTKNETLKNSLPKKIWEKYSQIGDIENTIKLSLVKASYKDNIVSLRYHNGLSKYMKSMPLATSFKQNLLKDGFKLITQSDKKSVYRSDKYQVVIMEQFDYLIVVMVKL